MAYSTLAENSYLQVGGEERFNNSEVLFHTTSTVPILKVVYKESGHRKTIIGTFFLWNTNQLTLGINPQTIF